MQTALASVEDLPVLPPMAAPSAGYRHYYSSLGAAARCACRPLDAALPRAAASSIGKGL
jgi:hypothetical protein